MEDARTDQRHAASAENYHFKQSKSKTGRTALHTYILNASFTFRLCDSDSFTHTKAYTFIYVSSSTRLPKKNGWFRSRRGCASSQNAARGVGGGGGKGREKREGEELREIVPEPKGY